MSRKHRTKKITAADCLIHSGATLNDRRRNARPTCCPGSSCSQRLCR